MASKAEFAEIVNQLLNFLLPRHLAADLKVSEDKILKWSRGESLPAGSEFNKLFKKMQKHSVWDDCF